MSGRAVTRKSPYVLAAESGRQYWWCACGCSRSQPLCDGSHRGSGVTPFPFTVAVDREIRLCGCKATRARPFCDGSHERL
jgi:CDGSH-type Zn-finger protein